MSASVITTDASQDDGRTEARIEAAIRYLRGHVREQPRLEEVAAAVGLSPGHFQRLFRRWVGVSPKRFLQFLTLEAAKPALAERPLLDVSLDLGLSGPGRLHDHFVSLEAVTPGDYRRGGEGLTIRHGVHAGPLGPVFVALTGRGVCALAFVDGDEEARVALRQGQARWPGAVWVEDPLATGEVAVRLFEPEARFGLYVQGSNFQLQVWKALLNIPFGATRSYGELARELGCASPRAVGQAVGRNPVSVLIPCHRVIRGEGGLGGYRWGTPRKEALLAWESLRREDVHER